MRSKTLTVAAALLGLSACGEGDWLVFGEEPRPCEQANEPCPAQAPFLLELVDLDGDAAAEFATVGLGGELAIVRAHVDSDLQQIVHVDAEWGSRLTRCSSASGVDDLLLYQSLDGWWLWRGVDGDLDLVASDRMTIGAVASCVDLGQSGDVVVEFADGVIRLLELEFSLAMIGSGYVETMVGMPGANASTVSIALAKRSSQHIHVVSLDLGTASVLAETSWSFGAGPVAALDVAGSDLIVARSTAPDAGELLIVHDVDPLAPTTPEAERIELPWPPALMRVAELDASPGYEVVVAPMPVTSIAIWGLDDSVDGLELTQLGIEAIDLATGDHDGDGAQEVYVLDPRQERIIMARGP